MFNWRQPKCIKLVCDLCEGEKGTIVQIRGKIVEHRYLSLLGIAVGRDVIVAKVENTRRERIVTLGVGDIKFTPNNMLSQHIQVEVPVIIGSRETKNLPKLYAKTA